MEKRAQASMEFLMTYGWAILAAVLAIGVLAYYGVFSPQNSLPNVCTVPAPFGCDEHQVVGGDATLILRNGAGTSITINNLSIANCDYNETAMVLADGQTLRYDITCSPAVVTGEKFNEAFTITYLRSGKSLTEYASGKMTAEVMA